MNRGTLVGTLEMKTFIYNTVYIYTCILINQNIINLHLNLYLNPYLFTSISNSLS